MYGTALPDLHLNLNDLIAEADKVVSRWTGGGTHQVSSWACHLPASYSD